MNKSRLTRSSALAALAASASAIAFPAIVRAQTPAIRVGGLTSDTFAMGYYAQEMGFFSKAGLNVQMLPFNNGSAQAEAAAGGSLDIGVGEATELANGAIRGLPFAIIAGGSLYNTNAPTTLWSSRKIHRSKRRRISKGKRSRSRPSSRSPRRRSARGSRREAQTSRRSVSSRCRSPKWPRRGARDGRCGAPRRASTHGRSGAPTADRQTLRRGCQAVLISDWFTTKDWLAENPDAPNASSQSLRSAAVGERTTATSRWRSLPSTQSTISSACEGCAGASTRPRAIRVSSNRSSTRARSTRRSRALSRRPI